MAKKTNSQQPRGIRAAGSKPSGSSAYPRDGRQDSLINGIDARADFTQLDRATLGNGKTYVVPDNIVPD